MKSVFVFAYPIFNELILTRAFTVYLVAGFFQVISQSNVRCTISDTLNIEHIHTAWQEFLIFVEQRIIYLQSLPKRIRQMNRFIMPDSVECIQQPLLHIYTVNQYFCIWKIGFGKTNGCRVNACQNLFDFLLFY